MRLVLPLLLLAACTQPDPDEPPVHTTKNVGPDGGVVVAEGASLTIPPGAVDHEVEITLEQLTDAGDPPPPDVLTLTTPIWRAAPVDLVLLAPVELTIEGSTDPEARLWQSAGASEPWTALHTVRGGPVSPAARTQGSVLTAMTDSLGRFVGAAIQDTASPGDTDETPDTDGGSDTGVTTDTDLPACTMPLPSACPVGQTEVCGGSCVPDFLANPGDPRGDCMAYSAQLLHNGVVPSPGYFGKPSTRGWGDPAAIPMLRTCWGEGRVTRPEYGDGVCDEEWNCDLLDWDGGDCAQHTTYTGQSASIGSAADLAALQSATELDVLEIYGTSLTSVALPNLVRLHHLYVHASALQTLSFAGLTQIDGRVQIVDAPALTTFSAPALRQIGGDWRTRAFRQPQAVRLDGLAKLATLELPALEHVGAGFMLSNLPKLTALELPSLVKVMGGLFLNNDTYLASLSLPALEHVGSHLSLDQAYRLPGVSLPKLQTVGNKLYLAYLASGPISLPSLRLVGALEHNASSYVPFDLSSLETVREDLRFYATTVNLSHLRTVGDSLDAHASSGGLNLCSLQQAASLSITINQDASAPMSRVSLTSWHGNIRRLAVSYTSPVHVQGFALDFPEVTAVESLNLKNVPGELVHLPKLTTVTDTMYATGDLDAPALTHVGRLVPSGEGLLLPAVETVDSLEGHVTDTLELPELHTLGAIIHDGLHAGTLRLPKLTQITGDVPYMCNHRWVWGSVLSCDYGLGVANVELPSLTTVHKFGISGTGRISLPALVTATDLAVQASEIDLPALTQTRDMLLYSTRPSALVNTPLVDVTGALELDGASVFSLPAVRHPASVYATLSAKEIRLPGMTQVDSFIAPVAKVLDISGLVSADYVQIGDRALPIDDRYGALAAWSTPPELRFDALERVGELWVIHSAGPQSIDLPRLTQIDRAVHLHDLPWVSRVSIPALERVQSDAWINLYRMKRLSSVDLSSLIEVGRLAVWYSGLSELDLPQVTEFHDRVSAWHNPALATVSYPGVTRVGGVDIGDNLMLSSLDLGSLSVVEDDVVVASNPRLDSCALSTATALWSIGGTREVTSNGPCSP